jgi:uncharacterized Zn finger protein
MDGDTIKSTIRGNINPYFGVYKEPRYEIEIHLERIPPTEWKTIIQRLSTRAGWLSRLLLGEVPEDIEAAFGHRGHSLLPRSARELKTRCSCPDWANPCKHVAGTYYHTARMIDQDPFLLFQLRGLTQDALQKELAKSPLGKALAQQLQDDKPLPPEPIANRYPAVPIEETKPDIDYKQFWNGKPLPKQQHSKEEPGLPALIIRREGDAPAFWQKENSFIETMSEIYLRVQTKSEDRW